MRKPNGDLEVLPWLLLEIFAANDDDCKSDGGKRPTSGRDFEETEKRMPQTLGPHRERRIKQPKLYSDNLICMVLAML